MPFSAGNGTPGCRWGIKRGQNYFLARQIRTNRSAPFSDPKALGRGARRGNGDGLPIRPTSKSAKGVFIVLQRLSVQLDRRIIRHVDPYVDVRFAAEVPDEGRAFQAPNVPNAVITQVPLFVEGQ